MDAQFRTDGRPPGRLPACGAAKHWLSCAGMLYGMLLGALSPSGLAAQAPQLGDALAARPATLGEIRSVLDKIPSCSEYLRQPPVEGAGATFVPAMRAEGIARAHFVIGADSLFPKPLGLRILHVIYFSDYDGPSSQITDRRRLSSIESTPLAAALRTRALGLAHNFPAAFDTAEMRSPTNEREEAKFTADEEIDADSWMRSLDGPYNDPLAAFYPRMAGPGTPEGAVARQDTEALSTATMNASLGEVTLNRLLLLASSSVRNMTGVIQILRELGADPNQVVTIWFGRGQKMLPLTLAVHGSACNVAALLAVGANPNLRDGLGHSALEIALEQGRDDIARILRAGGAVPH